jgi:hypothetical protein
VRGQVSAGDGDIADLTGGEFDLAMADVSGQTCQPGQLQDAAVKRMAWVGDGDLALVHLRDQRCITLAGV